MRIAERDLLFGRARPSAWNRAALVLIAAALVLSGGAGPARAGWQTFLPSDGLLSGLVWDVDAGPDGNVWFLTQNGVSRYDGLTWTNYPQSPDLRGMSLLMGCLLADQRGNVWVASTRTSFTAGVDPLLLKFDGAHWEPVWTDRVKGTHQMIEDSGGNIWFATDFGVVRFDGVDWTTYRRDNGEYYDQYYCLLQDRQGALWCGTRAGLRRFRDGVWTDIASVDGLDLGRVNAIHEDRQGAIWIGTNPIRRFDGTTWTTYGTADTPPWLGTFSSGSPGSPVRFADDREGNLWMIVNGTGLVRYRDGVWKVYRDSDDTRISALESLAIDGDDNLWLATRLGAVRFDGEDWDYLRPGSQTTTSDVNAILEERPGVCWLGTANGLYRYENGTYTVYTTGNGLLGDLVYTLEWGPDGALWVGGERGISIFNGTNWTTRTVPNTVWDILRHSSGEMYLATDGGLIRISGAEWTVYDTEHGLPGNSIYSVAEDDSGRVWAAGYGCGVGRFDGQEWRWFTLEDGLPSMSIYKVTRGRGHEMWVSAWSGGIGRFDGERWTTYGIADGLASDNNFAILVDREGVVWAGSSEVSRFDGTFWKTITLMDGLLGSNTRTFTEDSAGHIWIGCEWGVAILDEDRVAPRAFFSPLPAAVSPARRQVLPHRAAFEEAKGILFSHSQDGAPWSDWTTENTWVAPDLNDGLHDLRVRARDSWGNVSPNPAHAVIEIDATSPTPLIASPAFGQAVRDSVFIRGSAADPRFRSYQVDFRLSGGGSWQALRESGLPVADGTLAPWDTRTVPDGDYELQVSVTDTLGLTGTTVVRVVVDNEAPWVNETSPATVSAAAGGNVYTTDGALHLYFPPRAFSETAVVTVAALSAFDVPDTLTGGAVRLSPGHEIGWAGAELQKPATLELSLAGAAEPAAGMRAALYCQPDGADWERLGGTFDENARTLTAAITRVGRYAVFADSGAPEGGAALSALTMTPRVFSPTGGFAADHLAISFSLGRSGPVTVKIYTRAGRLVRTVTADQLLGAGVNVVRWDGRDDDGDIVSDNLYLVTVQAAGEKQVKPVSVVR